MVKSLLFVHLIENIDQTVQKNNTAGNFVLAPMYVYSIQKAKCPAADNIIFYDGLNASSGQLLNRSI
jgi:hypothetical protein